MAIQWVLLCMIFMVILTLIGVKIKRLGLKKFVIDMIVIAEEIYQHGQNDEKFNYVFDRLYALLPTFIRFFISKKMVQYFIQKIFNEIKTALDYPNKNEV